MKPYVWTRCGRIGSDSQDRVHVASDGIYGINGSMAGCASSALRGFLIELEEGSSIAWLNASRASAGLIRITAIGTS